MGREPEARAVPPTFPSFSRIEGSAGPIRPSINAGTRSALTHPRSGIFRSSAHPGVPLVSDRPRCGLHKVPPGPSSKESPDRFAASYPVLCCWFFLLLIRSSDFHLNRASNHQSIDTPKYTEKKPAVSSLRPACCGLLLVLGCLFPRFDGRAAGAEERDRNLPHAADGIWRSFWRPASCLWPLRAPRSLPKRKPNRSARIGSLEESAEK